MPIVTPGTLKGFASAIRADRALLYAEALEAGLPPGELSTPLRVQHFMAQIAHESGGFRALVESTAYTDPVRLDQLFKNVQGVAHAERLIAAGPQAIADTIYAHKLGNGGVGTGDGYRYRGRGFMMVTGRANYRAMAKVTGLPLEEEPDLLGQPGPAAEAAARFWAARKINLAADADEIDAVTVLVNGPAKLHLPERKRWLALARGIWK